MITQLELQEMLTYDKDTGVFTWNAVEYRTRRIAGDSAGSKHKHGYLVIRLGKKVYPAHQVAWLYVYGTMPKYIDHINHIRDDNRLENLRDVTSMQNNQNRTKSDINSSGVVGVYWRKDTSSWTARITVDGKQKALGSYEVFSEAVNARKNAEVLYGFHENHGKNKGEI